MAISEDDRLALRSSLTPTIGERATRVLMEVLPPVNYDEITTRDDLENQRLLLSSDIREVRTGLQSEIREVRTDLQSRINELRTDVQSQIDELRVDLTSQIYELRVDNGAEFVATRAELKHEMTMLARTTIITQFASMIGLTALVATLA
ncbi:MAG: hypothetical protein IH940_10970 [Acidobacteria bacterium]|nr:hypothetical protein [Acidobacteriota bacterium]